MNKKMLYVFIGMMCVCIMTTSICFATDNVTSDSDTISTSKAVNTQTTKTKTTTGTLTDLKNDIQNSWGELTLDRDYVYNSSTDSEYKSTGIAINGSDIDINGENHFIDMKSAGSFISVTNSKLNITNLTIKNTVNSTFKAINSTLLTSNVTFINENKVNTTAVTVISSNYTSTKDSFINLNHEDGSVVYAISSNVDIFNSTFDLKDKQTWGAIKVYDTVLHVINTTFSDMKSKYATAIYGSESMVIVRNSTFKNLEADLTGGAIAVKEIPLYTIISGCEFINVTSGHNGGAIFADITGSNPKFKGEVNIKNTTFRDCSSEFGGAILQLGGGLLLHNTTFSDNSAEIQGGAIYTSFTDLRITGSILKNNSVPTLYEDYNRGGALYADNGSVYITNTRFYNNKALEGIDAFIYDSDYTISDSYFSGNIQTMFDGKDSELNNNTFLKENIINNNTYYYVYESNTTNITYNPVIIDSSLSKNDYFNLVDLGLVSPVKNQGSMGACWTFGVTGSLESAFLKATNKSLLLDISETNIQDAGLRYSMFGVKNSLEASIPQVGASYMLSWLGVTTSDVNEYDELGKISPIIDNGNKYHIHNIVVIPSRENVYDNQKLKDALVAYGVLAISVHGARIGNDYNPKTKSSYYTNSTWGANADHTVTLVGWNDSYSKNNFATPPPGDGAWIIKNSWGSDWGDKGYYYVSYYDTAVATATNFGFIVDGNYSYQKNYQHDIIGEMNFRDINETVSYANNFTSTGNEILAAIGTYMNKSGEEYFIKIYLNGSLLYTQKGISNFSGYQTIKLDKYVILHEGDNFIVEVGAGNLIPISQESRLYNNGNISFMVSNGQFIDLSSYSRVPSLKAYTIPDKSNIKINNTQDIIQVKYYDEYGNILSNSTVYFKLNGQTYSISTDENGQIVYNLTLPVGKNVITLINPINGDEENITITKSDKSHMDYNNTENVIQVEYFDVNGEKLANTNVSFKVNGEMNTISTDENGQVVLNLTLPVGENLITLINPINGYEENLTITIHDKSHIVYNNTEDVVQVQYFDEYGEKLANTNVSFKVNGEMNTTSTDEDGQVVLNLTLPVGENVITLINPINGEEQNITITIPDNHNKSDNKKTFNPNRSNHKTLNKKTVKKVKDTNNFHKLYTVKVHGNAVFKGNFFTLMTLKSIFGQEFINGHLVVYIDGKVVFNATVNDDLSTVIFEIINSLLGNHELKVEFTVNGDTKTYTENITIE